jgi:hypothetical protein
MKEGERKGRDGRRRKDDDIDTTPPHLMDFFLHHIDNFHFSAALRLVGFLCFCDTISLRHRFILGSMYRSGSREDIPVHILLRGT